MPQSGFITDQANAILDLIFNGGSLTPPSSFYIGLFTAAPTFAGGGVEVSGAGYARQEVVNWLAAADRQIANDAAITFPIAGATWGNVVAAGLFDAVSGGNLWAFGLLTQPIDIPVGATRRFPIGVLKFRFN